MLRRPARQILTAGKSNELVADGDGPLPNHSVFTGHLLKWLEEQVRQPDRIVCGNELMAQIYSKVASDPHSEQTPHYGYFDGEGDFIFNPSVLSDLSTDEKTDTDILLQTTPVLVPAPVDGEDGSVIDLVKTYLPARNCGIKLDDLVTREIRKVLSQTGEDAFPVSAGEVTQVAFIERINRYEKILGDLQKITILLGYWGNSEQESLLRKAIGRVNDGIVSRGGPVVWLSLRWYPCEWLMYSSGIGAIASNNYRNLATVLNARMQSIEKQGQEETVLSKVVDADLEIATHWKWLPGHERHYTPRSEYLHKALQPSIDDLLFVGRDYESLFDRFEILRALVHADSTKDTSSPFWGPPGRFAWKHRSRGIERSPFAELLKDAQSQGDEWGPLRAGLFRGQLTRFEEVWTAYEEVIRNLSWF